MTFIGEGECKRWTVSSKITSPDIKWRKTTTPLQEKSCDINSKGAERLRLLVNALSSDGKLDHKWLSRLKELRSYKYKYGNCHVPKDCSENPKLGIWVDNQRQQYRLLREGRPSYITPERIRLLESLGFSWFLRDKWNGRFAELEQYKAVHGNCLVPKEYTANPQLGTWVNNQRTQYQLLKKGKPSQMTQERVNMLNNIGFIWATRDFVDWDIRMEELRAFKAKHGNCLVPQRLSSNRQLGRWVSYQRTQYKLLTEGQVSQLTERHISELDEVGFVWSLRSKKKTSVKDSLKS
eukprot:CAMPEP_0195530098 /NCGR_PEP_ID=MMETSP0794_2-20130614/32856_1 /TAXON_ID=515487 /ORGANISM="Stephanopyxis turris, Strain CCMP 815" /LENGTH=292 /DNA_ID=CAMNT_0040661519 /DNA_START=41 /DNA_END=919 /DNA_ORIENTATION=-